MKRTAMAILALSSSITFAGTMGCAPGMATVPCERTAWDFGIEALYLQHIADADLGYLGQSIDNTANLTAFSDYDSDWDWGFRLQGSYHFNTGNDFTVSWIHYDVSNKHNSSFGIDNLVTDLRMNLKHDWDQVNFEFGQHVDFGEVKDIRFHGGLSYTRIKNRTHSNFNVNAQVVTPVSSNLSAEFSGVGPRVGADLSYGLANGFKVYAKSAMALYAGTSKFHVSTTIPSVTKGSKNAMVPELEAKLGANYTMNISNGDLSFDVGYMWTNYFNALHATPVPGIIAESDSAYHGLTFGAHWVGNIA